jgi:hypothetical protein
VSGAELRHRLIWLAAGLRRAAQDVGVDLPVDYAQRVAVEGIRLCDQMGVTPIGRGVAIHTAPSDARQLRILLGYADPAGQEYRDGSLHTPPPATSVPPAGVNLDTIGAP